MPVTEMLDILIAMPKDFEIGIESGYNNENNQCIFKKLSGEYQINYNTREVFFIRRKINEWSF